MALKNISAGSLLLALAMVGVICSTGFEAWKAMSEKAVAQEKAVEEFQTWKRQYTQLLPVEQQWKKDLNSVTVVKDLYSVYTLLGTSPWANPDTLMVDKVERLKHDGVDIQAQRVCLTSMSDAGVRFEESSFEDLMTGLQKMAERPDVQIGAITFSYEGKKAAAVVKDFCLLLRDADGTGQ